MMEADFVEFATANLGRTAEDDMGNEDLVDEVFSKKRNHQMAKVYDIKAAF